MLLAASLSLAVSSSESSDGEKPSGVALCVSGQLRGAEAPSRLAALRQAKAELSGLGHVRAFASVHLREGEAYNSDVSAVAVVMAALRPVIESEAIIMMMMMILSCGISFICTY